MQGIVASIARRVLGLALTIAALCLPTIANAATYFVGTCRPGKAGFTTITQAVNTVPAGSIIEVCPGTYPEFVYIQQPLTLQGIQSGDNAGATITVPTTGEPSINQSVATQVLVWSPGGPVNIGGIVIDGTGATAPQFSVGYASILYDSTSGTIDHVVTQNLPQNFTPSSGLGEVAGIVLQDDSTVSPTVTIKNSIVNIPLDGLSEYGIYVPTSVPSGNISLNVTNTSILVTGTTGLGWGIYDQATGTGTFNNNTILANFTGILTTKGTFSITGNTITGAIYGVNDTGTTATTITGNDLINNSLAIQSFDPNLTIKGNEFSGGATSYAIDFDCTSPVAISGNVFVGTPIALQNVPSGTSLKGTAGSYFGVQTIEALCP